jgi:hypothetical protein
LGDFPCAARTYIGRRGGLYMIQGGFSTAEMARAANPEMPLKAAASYL